MNDSPQTITLRDYLRVLRRQRRLIALTVLVAIGVALAHAALQAPVYTATAAMKARDPNRDLDLLGTPAPPEQTPEKLAAARAQTVVTPAVAREVKKDLKTRRSVLELMSSVTARVEAVSNLVLVEARAGSPAVAARTANSFVLQFEALLTKAERERFADAAEALRGKLDDIGSDSAKRVHRERIARLVSLSAVADPADVVGLAEPSATPTSPKPVRSAIVASLVGLLLGIPLAFARNSLDRRLRSSHEVAEELDLPLLGHVRDEAMGQPPLSANGRPGLQPMDLESFRILRMNLEFLDPERQIRRVLVTSALPEEGKSTVAAALARTSAAAGRRTLLVECDLRRPVLASRLGLEPTPGLSDYLTGSAEPQAILRVIESSRLFEADDASGEDDSDTEVGAGPEAFLVCIPSGSPTSRPAEALASDAFRRFLDQVSEAYDTVVLDTSPLLSVVDTRELVPLVDGILFCVRAARTTRDEALAAKEALAHLPSRPTGVVVTGARPDEDTEYEYYSYQYQQ